MAEKEKDLKEITEDTNKYRCIVQKALLFLNEFIDGPMCARCLPCPMGSYEMRIRFQKLSNAEATARDLEVIKQLAPFMLESSMCKKGKDTAKFIIETLDKTPEIYDIHVAGGCTDRECKGSIQYKVIPDKCVSCDECRVVCKDYAILGEKKIAHLSGFIPYEIVDMRCTRCGECLRVCRYGAIEIVDKKVLETVKA
ncbi:NADH-ubiquinone oxidoreductase-F iron-sulfur binding region domain-containing protein [Candidatus Magnetominusculus xianensis]|uniref:NADH dehydrogenase n=1 Tax=Candidatus Magnetominusculus xianensis TaxID=1748249 RepID=A0ABR5SC26_9BACT|nr:NADH-ubiquinone oxidoreductase-F iron-sulfur binding region domain-containing protein [Candidatus Magnetominusculus xianensis]KWT78978.1 NADH dehydrogenase [Candidatus Magnetominusculus xianensis]MBF0405015.1 4Fe-4S dicluster domain-containing protein [Nitrospirota bacterium]